MRTLKILKWISLAVFIAALLFAIVCLSQPVRFHKTGYDSSYWPSSSQKETESTVSTDHTSVTGGTEPVGTVQKPSTETMPTASTKPQPTETAKGWEVYDFGFIGIELPREYAASLVVLKWEEDSNIYNSLLSVYERASREEALRDMGEAMGMLFEIGYVKISEYDSFVQLDYPESHVFAKDSTRYYIYTEPSDYQFYRSDGGTSAEMDAWQTLQEIGPKVQEYFLEINNVENYTIENQYPQQGGWENTTEPTVPVRENCEHCDGTGLCSFCLFGDCPSCYGSGRDDCVSCIGLGECGSCGGSGYTYKGTGLNFRKVECSRCDGSGDCGSCGGRGYSDCYMCDSTGNCCICDGNGFCEYCGGSGSQ